MPGEYEIDQIVDLAAADKNISGAIALIEKLEARLKEISQIQLNISGATKLNDVAAAVNQASTAMAGFKSETRQGVAAINALKDAEAEIRLRGLEATAALKEQALTIRSAKEESRQKAISDKEAAAIAKKASQDEIFANQQRILSLREAEKLEQSIAIAEKERADAESARLASAASNRSTGNRPAPQVASEPAFTPVTRLEEQVQYLQKNMAALDGVRAAQKNLRSELAAGTISQAQYDREINKAIILENEYKRSIAAGNAEVKNIIRSQESIKGSLEQRRAALIRLNKEYDNLGPQERNSAYGQRLLGINSRLTTQLKELELASGRAQRNVGNYGNAITGAFSKAFGVVRNLAYLLPGIGIAGILGLAVDGIVSLVQSFTDANKSIDTFKANYENVTEVITTANKEAGKGIADLKILYGAATDVNKSTSERTAAVRALKSEFPEYFKNISDEAILNGKAKKSYDELTKSIIESSRAEAARAKIQALEAQRLDIDNQRRKIKNATDNEQSRIKAQTDAIVRVDEFGRNVKQRGDLEYAQEAINNRRIKALRQEDLKEQSIDDQEAFLMKQIGEKAITKVVIDEGEGRTKTTADKVKTVNKQFFADRIRDEIEFLKLESTNENIYLQERIAKRQRAYDLEKGLALRAYEDEKKANQDKLNDIVRNNSAALALPNNAKNAAAIKSANVAITNAQNEYRAKAEYDAEQQAFKLEELEAKHAAALVAIRANYLKVRRDQDREANEQAQASFKAQDAVRQKDIDRENERATTQIAANQSTEISALDAQFNRQFDKIKGNAEKRKKLEEDYAKNRAKIEEYYSIQIVEQQIKYAELIIKAQKASGMDTSSQEKTLYDLKAKYADLLLKKVKDTNEREITENQKKYLSLEKDIRKFQDIYATVTGLINGALSAGTEREKNRLQDEIDLVEKKKSKELEAIAATTQSEQDKAAAIAVVNARAASTREALELRQRQADQRRAQFEKAANIGKIAIETAAAVIHQLGTGDPFTAFGRALAVGAIGAAQLAIAIATPVPKYFAGKGEHDRYEGPAYVGDGGRAELIHREDGRMEVTPATKTLTYVNSRDIIYPDAKPFLAKAKVEKMPVVQNTVNVDTKGIISAINGQPRPVIKNTLNGWVYGYQQDRNYTEWKNRNMQS